MSEVKSDMQIAANVFVKMYTMESVGDKIEGHSHTFDHITLLATGSVVMKARGQEKTHVAPKLLITPLGIAHEFVSLEPNTTLCCIHAIREGDGIDDVAPQDITRDVAMHLFNKHTIVAPEIAYQE
jgi:quercetin dioxygenase-like cupin family protein